MDHSRPLWEVHVLGFPTAGRPRAPLPRRRRLAAVPPHRLHPPHRRPGHAAVPAARPPPRGRPRVLRRAAAAAAAAALLQLRGRGRAAGGRGRVGGVAPRARVAHGGGCGTLRRDGGVGAARPADAAQGRRGRRVPAQALREPHAQPRQRQARQQRHELREIGKKNIEVRSTLLVNLRQTPGLHTLASMMESGKDNGAKWGNRLGYMIIPFHIAEHDDVLEYVRKATNVARRKKSSMESVFTYWSAHMIMKIFGIKAAASLCYGMMRNTTLSFSNMVGPTEQVVLYGHPIVYIAPSVYGHPHALTMHYQSYMNIIKLVLAVDGEQFPDAHDLLDDVAESLRLIREAASGKRQDTSHAERCSPVARRQGDIS